jgi:hypothetical protein
VGVKTHYHQGRTQPCTGVLCDGCDAKRATRFEAYISLVLSPTNEHVIFALTENAAQQLKAAEQKHGHLRGLYLALKRMGSRPNGRLVAEAFTPKDPPEYMPATPPLRQLLLKIWRVPAPESEEPKPPYVKAAETMIRNHRASADVNET